MFGQTCLVSIKKELELHNIPVLIFSTSIYEPVVKMAYQAGAFKYFQKPHSLEEYKIVVSEMLATPIIS